MRQPPRMSGPGAAGPWKYYYAVRRHWYIYLVLFALAAWVHSSRSITGPGVPRKLMARKPVQLPGSGQQHLLSAAAATAPATAAATTAAAITANSIIALKPLKSAQQAAQQLPAKMTGGTLHVITGANTGYFSGLTNLVGSVHYWCPDCHIAIYNLGLTADEIATVDTWCNTTLHWRAGLPKLAGSGGDLKKYAWKPYAVQDAVDTYGTVLWLDAGSTVTGHLKPAVLPLLTADGHYFVQGQDLDMTRWCYEGTFAYFKTTAAQFKGKPSYSGNTVGFVKGSTAYFKILKPWVQCALKQECISPPGSSLANHRYDQSVLTILTYNSGMNITAHTEHLSAAPLPCFKPDRQVVWTSRQAEDCYQKLAVCSSSSSLQLGAPRATSRE